MRTLIVLLVTSLTLTATDPHVSRVEVTVSPTPGRTEVLAAVTGQPAVLVAVTVDGSAPTPPAPLPGPVNPPAPVPVDDALVVKLRAAHAAETSAKKAEFLDDLIELYSQAQSLAIAADVKTTGELAARVRTAGAKLLGKDDLTGVRKILAAELALAFPADAPLTDTSRKSAAATFKRLHDALTLVKK